MPRLILLLRNLVYKNRRYIRAGNLLQLPASSEQRLKKLPSSCAAATTVW